MKRRTEYRKWRFLLAMVVMCLLVCAGTAHVQAKTSTKKLALSRTRITTYKGHKPTRLKVNHLKEGQKVRWVS